MITKHQQYSGLVGIWVCWSFATVFIGLRIYCKQLRARKLYWDDWLLIASWLSLLVVCAVSTVNLDVSAQLELPSPDTIVLLTRINLVSVTFSIIASSWSKVSFAVTLLRIADGWITRFLWVAIVLINIFFGLAATFFWVSCKPIEKAWTPTTPGTCWDPWVHVYVAIVVSAFSGVMDIFFAILPWRILKAVHVIRERIGIAIAMSMGVIAGVFAFVKCVYFPNLARGDASTGIILGVMGVAEPAATIMAASVPTMRVLFKEVIEGERSYQHNYRLGAFGYKGGDNFFHINLESISKSSEPESLAPRTRNDAVSPGSTTPKADLPRFSLSRAGRGLSVSST